MTPRESPDEPTLPARRGPAPRVIGPQPHAQRSQNAPAHLQEELLRRALGLPGVREAASQVSVPGARAFVLDAALAGGPREAFPTTAHRALRRIGTDARAGARRGVGGVRFIAHHGVDPLHRPPILQALLLQRYSLRSKRHLVAPNGSAVPSPNPTRGVKR